MALQFSLSYRDAILDQIETVVGAAAKLEIFTGAPPADCGSPEAGTKLAEFDLSSSWMDAAAGGSNSLSNLPLATTGSAAGVPGHFRLLANDGITCHLQGTVALSGADMTIDTAAIVVGKPVNVVLFTITAPGA